jgi:short-subunit dehydrogenase
VGKGKKEKLPTIHPFMNKKVLIVGGSSGLGRQLAILYTQHGATVGVIARRDQLLAELKNEFPSIHIQQADIALSSIIEKFGRLVAEMKGLDIVIIAASVIHFNKELAHEPENATVQVNVQGFMQVIDTAWTYLKSTGGGQIVGITSIAAVRGNQLAPAYHASKAFQSIYLESLRVRAAHEKNNIWVTELIPGYMKTDMGKGDRMFWVAKVEKAAKQSFRAINNKRKRAFITKRWWLIWQFQKVLPIFIYVWLVKGIWGWKK